MIPANELRVGSIVAYSSEIMPLGGNAKSLNLWRTRKLAYVKNPEEYPEFYAQLQGEPLRDKFFERHIVGFVKQISWKASFGTNITLEVSNDNPDDDKLWRVCVRHLWEDMHGLHCFDIICIRKDLRYVHELQLIYFALTGKELIIQQEKSDVDHAGS